MQNPEEDVRAFVGPNADYYLQAWAAADPNGGRQALRWNWPAFFLNVIWMLYRKMYKYFWISFGALVAIGAAEGIVEAMLSIKGPGWWDIVINFAVAGFFGAYGTWFYYRHATFTIAQTKAQHTSPEAIVRAGGVRWLWPVLILGGAVVLGIVAAILVPRLTHSS